MAEKHLQVWGLTKNLLLRACVSWKTWSAVAMMMLNLWNGRQLDYELLTGGIACHPAEPFLRHTSSSWNLFIMVVCTLLLLSDAPFFYNNDVFTVNRIGRKCWFASRVLYMALMCAGIVVLHIAGATLFSCTNIDWLQTKYTLPVGAFFLQTDARAVQASPWEGFCYTAMYMWACLFFLSLVMCGCNMWMNARYGIVPAVAVCLCENILSTNLSGQWYYILPVYRMHYYNYALTEIQRKSIHAPYVWESIVYYGVLIGICLFIIALQTRKYEFAVMKSREDGDE